MLRLSCDREYTWNCQAENSPSSWSEGGGHGCTAVLRKPMYLDMSLKTANALPENVNEPIPVN